MVRWGVAGPEPGPQAGAWGAQAEGSVAAESTVAPSAHSSHPKGRPSVRCKLWCVARFFFQPKLKPQWEQAKGLGPGGDEEGEWGEAGASVEDRVRLAASCTLWCRTRLCEATCALGALVGPLAGMDALVADQVCLLAETLLTFGARKGPLSGVGLLVRT